MKASLTPNRRLQSRSVLVTVPTWPHATMAIKFGYVIRSAFRCPPESIGIASITGGKVFYAVTNVTEPEFRNGLDRPGICCPKGIRFIEQKECVKVDDKTDWSEWAKADPVIATMIKLAIPITRDNYLEIAYLEGLPEEWTAELEAALPEPLQLSGS